MKHTTLRIAVLAATALATLLPLPQDLGGLGGSPLAVHAVGVTRNGVVVGDAPDGDNQQHAVIWRTR